VYSNLENGVEQSFEFDFRYYNGMYQGGTYVFKTKDTDSVGRDHQVDFVTFYQGTIVQQIFIQYKENSAAASQVKIKVY